MTQRTAVPVVGAAILDGARCLVARRGPGMTQPGLWELPGGKVEPRESRERALARELEEELGVRAAVGSWLARSDVVVAGARIVLDVYAVSTPAGEIQLREHAEVRWVGADGLDALRWAPADLPVLPILASRLRDAPDARRAARTPAVVSADWGGDARRRACCVATRDADGWRVRRASPPPGGWSLAGLLELAGAIGRERAAPVVVGVDAALGLPAAFARSLGCRDFLAALAALRASGGLEDASVDAATWRASRPFFRVPRGAGGLSRFVAAAGGRSGLLRQVELRTGAKPVFVLSGIPGSVGSGSRALWRELGPLLADPARRFRIWPFEGTLHELTQGRGSVLAEVYPAASYALALAERLPARPSRLAKTRPAARAGAIERLLRQPWLRRARVSLADVDRARAGEDDFDALFLALALVRLLSEAQPLSGPAVDPRCEGGLLGTGGLAPAAPPPLRR